MQRPSSHPSHPLDVAVSADTAGDALDIELTNVSQRALQLYEHSLPWKGVNSLILIAVLLDAQGTLVDKEVPIDDPGPALVGLAPGGALRGRVSLAVRFPRFAEARRSRDVGVFWSYGAQTSEGEKLGRSGGFLLFPKR
jgi:hypothetical protein